MSNQCDEIKKVWRLIEVEPDSVLELRAIWPKTIPDDKGSRTNHFRAADYQSLDELKTDFERRALQLNDQGFNIYTVMNRIKPFLFVGEAAKDSDVIARTLLLIDIDRTGTPKCPASDRELSAAKSLANQVRAHLSELDWPEPIVVMSGNGYHLYYRLASLPNNDTATALCKTTLNHLASLFNNDEVAVDTAVFNASRITKLPGTIMRKGMETEDRPYRMAVVCDEE